MPSVPFKFLLQGLIAHLNKLVLFLISVNICLKKEQD